MHLSGQQPCWSLRWIWSIACRRCSNYSFILDLTPGFNGLGKGNCTTGGESFKLWDLVRLILEVWQYMSLKKEIHVKPYGVSLIWIMNINIHWWCNYLLWVFAFLCCTQIARFMGPTWGPSGADRTQMGPMLAPWTLLSGWLWYGSLLVDAV